MESLTVVFSRLGTTAGAEGTLVDFCIAALRSGRACHLIIAKSTIWQRVALRRRLGLYRERRGQLTVSGSHRLLDFKVSRSVHVADVIQTRHLPVTTLRHIINPLRPLARRRLFMSKSVLVGDVLSNRGLQELRTLAPKAQILLNHNGEPADLLERWARRDAAAMLSREANIRAYAEHMSSFSLVLFQSTAQEQAFKQILGADGPATQTLWPSCDERDALRARQGQSPYASEKLNIVCVAKFQPRKGQLQLLQAFKALLPDHPEMHLTFVGGSVDDQSYLAECQEFSRSWELDHSVTFIGATRDPLPYTAHCDLFALTSAGEGVSRAVREAAFLGRPILTTRLDGLVSFLSEHGAFFCANSEVDEVKKQLRRAAGSTAARQQKGAVASQRFRSLASFETFCSAVDEMLLAFPDEQPQNGQQA